MCKHSSQSPVHYLQVLLGDENSPEGQVFSVKVEYVYLKGSLLFGNNME